MKGEYIEWTAPNQDRKRSENLLIHFLSDSSQSWETQRNLTENDKYSGFDELATSKLPQETLEKIPKLF